MAINNQKIFNKFVNIPFTICPNEIITAPISLNAFRLWTFIAMHDFHGNGCCLSRETLAKGIGACHRKISYSLRELENFGFLEVKRKRGRANYYFAYSPFKRRSSFQMEHPHAHDPCTDVPHVLHAHAHENFNLRKRPALKPAHDAVPGEDNVQKTFSEEYYIKNTFLRNKKEDQIDRDEIKEELSAVVRNFSSPKIDLNNVYKWSCHTCEGVSADEKFCKLVPGKVKYRISSLAKCPKTIDSSLLGQT